MSDFACLCCGSHFDNPEDAAKHPCNHSFMMKNGVISIEMSKFTGLKRTRWGRFQDKILSMDIGWGLAFMGLVIVNMFVVLHMNLSTWPAIIESLSVGFAIPRLLK